MKRLFTILMMAAMVAVSCSKDTTSEIDNSPKIEFEDSKAFMKCIVNWDKNHDGQFSEAEAAAVTSLGEVFSWCEMESFDELKYFTGITAIEDDAFYYCSNLKSIPIPANVTTIGKHAFANCSDLKSVYCLIATPPTLGEGAFDDNDMSRKIYVPTASVSAYKAAWNQYATAIVGYGNSTSAPLERIELSAETTTIAPSKSLQITVTYYPENAEKPELYWKSSNHDVALVGMNGKVTAFEVGTATITAYTYDEKISASIDITVADNSPITFADSDVICSNCIGRGI